MKKSLFAIALFAIAGAAGAADVGVSINVGQPGFYGQIDIGNAPRPTLVYARPVVIQRDAHYAEPPMYLRVPPGHAKRWSRYCREYNACNRKVYFVQDNWYKNVYAPHYQREHEGHRDHRDNGDRQEHDQRGDQGERGEGGKQHGNGRGKH